MDKHTSPKATGGAAAQPHTGQRIAQRLDELGMTKAEFGRRMGTSRQNINSLLLRPLVPLDLLWKASLILQHDFFGELSAALHAADPRCAPPAPPAVPTHGMPQEVYADFIRATLALVNHAMPACAPRT
jgi:hypothetical protein